MLRRESPVTLDISWRDFAFALTGCLSTSHSPDPAATQGLEDGNLHPLTCLSVRSGLDLLLRALELPKGSEVLVTAITHSDMIEILHHHGLVPVPVDLKLESLAPKTHCLEQARTPHTRALLFTHLFGGQMELQAASDFCKKHDLRLIEDCAEAYLDKDYKGSDLADLSMFSFGPLKTSTALAGALVWVRDFELFCRMESIMLSDPVASNLSYAKRVLKLALLQIGLHPRIYGPVAAWMERNGPPFIETSRAWMHSFPGRFNVQPLRRRPSPALLRMMTRRLLNHDVTKVRERQLSGELSLSQMPSVQVPGHAAHLQSWWIFPVLVADPEAAMAELRAGGFEPVPGLSNLVVVEPPEDRPDLEPEEARYIARHAILIPVRPRLRLAERLRLSQIVNKFAVSRKAPIQSVHQ